MISSESQHKRDLRRIDLHADLVVVGGGRADDVAGELVGESLEGFLLLCRKGNTLLTVYFASIRERG